MGTKTGPELLIKKHKKEQSSRALSTVMPVERAGDMTKHVQKNDALIWLRYLIFMNYFKQLVSSDINVVHILE